MAKISGVNIYVEKGKKKGKFAKTKESANKRNKNYKKAYVGQGKT